jgi:hypothetical protein
MKKPLEPNDDLKESRRAEVRRRSRRIEIVLIIILVLIIIGLMTAQYMI